MRTKLLFLLIVLLFVRLGYSNDRKTTNKFDIKFGYQNYPWMGDVIPFSDDQFTPTGYCEANYRFHELFCFGLFWGFGMYEWADLSSFSMERDYNTFSSGIYEKRMKPMLLYGINSSFKILPLFIKKNNFFMDVYVSAKLGGIYFDDRNKEFDETRESIDYGVYGGIAVYPFKKFGLFYEYGYGNYVKWRTGLSFRF